MKRKQIYKVKGKCMNDCEHCLRATKQKCGLMPKGFEKLDRGTK